MYTPRRKETLMPIIRKGSSSIYSKKENNHLETIANLLKIASSFSIVSGGITVFFYLNSIKHPNVFAEAVGSPYSLIAIIIVFFILFLLIYIGFITPYAILLGKSDTPQKVWDYLLENRVFSKIFFTLFTPHALYSYLLIGLLTIPKILETMKIEEYFKYLLWTIIASPLIPFIFYFFKDKSQPISKRIKSYGTVFFYAFSASSLGLIFPMYMALHLTQWAPNEWKQYSLLIGYEVALLLNLVFASFFLSSKNNSKNKKYILLFPAIPIYLLMLLLFILTENFPFRLLHPIRFVESPSDATWYFLNRNNSKINDEDLKKIKLHFAPQSIEQEEDNKIEICTRKAEWLRNASERKNALFGYMAWNLGDKKIFCPVTVNNIKASQIEDMPNKCLPIEGNALQKIHKSYISSHSITQ